MLTRLQRHPLLAGAGQILTDAVRYLAIMVVLVMLLGYVARLVMGTS
jgi:hypothetical protein